MVTDSNFVTYLVEQMKPAGDIIAKKMFGEYGVYCDGIFFGVICDNKLFIKPTDAGREFIGHVIEASAYPGAKPSFLIEEKVDDKEWLCQLIQITIKHLPLPKAKKKKKK